MSKKLIAAMCLCGLTWAGSASASFIGNDIKLQFDDNSGSYSSIVTVSSDPTNTLLYTGTLQGIGIDIFSSSVEINIPNSLSGGTLTISDVNQTMDPISGASLMGGGTLSFGEDFVQLAGVVSGLSTIDVSFGTGTAPTLLNTSQLQILPPETVPEPRSFNLMALGLIILGVTAYQRRLARV